MSAVRIGILFPDLVWHDTSKMEPSDRVRACLERCEHHGYDVWVADHLLDAPGLYGASWLDPLIFLSYAAAITKTVSIGTQILVAPIRHPVVTAKQIASLHELSEGRFQLGIGAGWNSKEFEAVGVLPKERGQRTDEILDALELLLTQDNASYDGRFYQFRDLSIRPRTGMPTLWAAGGSRFTDAASPEVGIHPSVLRRIMRAGNWMSRAATTPELIVRDWQTIKAYVQEHGADPSSITFGHLNFFHITGASNREEALARQEAPFRRVMGSSRPLDVLQQSYLMGTVGEIIRRLNELIGQGCTYLCVGPTSADPAQIDLLASEIVPHLNLE